MKCMWLKSKDKSICIGCVYVEDNCLVFNGQETVKFKLSESDLRDKYVDLFVNYVNELTGKVVIWYGIDKSTVAYLGGIVDFQVYENNVLVKGLMIDYLE